jgi:hypothetical protein
MDGGVHARLQKIHAAHARIEPPERTGRHLSLSRS